MFKATKMFVAPITPNGCHSDNNLVVLGYVTKGKLLDSDKIEFLRRNKRIHTDSIARMEKNCRMITKATTTEGIGICLKTSSPEDLKKVLELSYP